MSKPVWGPSPLKKILPFVKFIPVINVDGERKVELPPREVEITKEMLEEGPFIIERVTAFLRDQMEREINEMIVDTFRQAMQEPKPIYIKAEVARPGVPTRNGTIYTKEALERLVK